MTAQRRNWQAMIGPLPTGPFAGKAHDLLTWIYQHPDLPASMRIECAKAAVQFETPRLAAAQNFNISTSLRDLVLESMRLDPMPATGDQPVLEHVPQSALPVIDARPEPMPSGNDIVPIEDAPESPGPAEAVARGPFMPADSAQDDAARYRELLQARREIREREERAPEPQVRPYVAPQQRYFPKSEQAADVAYHVDRIRRARGFD